MRKSLTSHQFIYDAEVSDYTADEYCREEASDSHYLMLHRRSSYVFLLESDELVYSVSSRVELHGIGEEKTEC